mmetsp:Transcript_45934/g.144450  ORF Transcript_45934/g.144450 Transcript_45934/m.144450 type:complete len:226 (-) Transcript_45934:115-792(-)
MPPCPRLLRECVCAPSSALGRRVTLTDWPRRGYVARLAISPYPPYLQARLRCTACTLSHCSEAAPLLAERHLTNYHSNIMMTHRSKAALLLAENSRALLSDTLIDGAPAAFVAGSWPGGRALELADGCRIRRVKRLWVDGDRPRLHVMSGDTAFVECFGEDEDEAAASLRSLHAAQREVRGDGESTTSTGSLEEQGYANIEALMEELDDMALSQAAAGSDAVQSS